MANIKFSQFTVGNVESDIDFVVGYKGGDNIQISPANLLSATLTGYLPLTGGTMTGNIKYNDSVRAQFGTGVNAEIQYTGSNFVMSNFTGDMIITNYTNDKDIIFQSDDGSGGVTEYFRIDGGYSSPYTIFPDNSTITLGSSLDLRIVHNGTDSFIDQTGSGNLYIRQKNDDKDIIFESDDGAGGLATYLTIDGSATKVTLQKDLRADDGVKIQAGSSGDLFMVHESNTSKITNGTGNLEIIQNTNDGDIIFNCDDGSGGIAEYFSIKGSVSNPANKYTVFPDNSVLAFGNSQDFRIYHSGSNTYINNVSVGDVYFDQSADDKDIIFRCDDGSGGVATYFYLDGSQGTTRFEKNAKWQDGKLATFGDADDLQIYHDGTTSNISNNTGNLSIINQADNSDIKFFSDDGSGGIAEYFSIKGSVSNPANKYTVFPDNSVLAFGNSQDFRIYHSGSNTFINNVSVGDVYFDQSADDKDIIFRCDDGFGGVAEYFRLDGGLTKTIVSKEFNFTDNVPIKLGTGPDFQMLHNGSNTSFENGTGNLLITNLADDSDIIFKSDDGSGGTAEYFRVDGGTVQTLFSKEARFLDNISAQFGSGGELRLYHTGTGSVIQNSTGNLTIQQDQNDGDIIFRSDDGSGGTTEYFRVDGGASLNVFSKDIFLADDKKALFGNNSDLQIYHDGSNSYIKDSGTGDLYIQGSDDIYITADNGEKFITCNTNDSVEIRYDNVIKFATTSTGINISGVSEYADNAAAIAGGLTTGDVYRTGDLLKIVH